VKRRVRVLQRAERDLLAIQRYIARDSPGAADRVIDELLEAIASLDESALRGTVPSDERLKGLSFRFLVVPPHLVFYKVIRRQVRVYRVLHGKRAYQDILEPAAVARALARGASEVLLVAPGVQLDADQRRPPHEVQEGRLPAGQSFVVGAGQHHGHGQAVHQDLLGAVRLRSFTTSPSRTFASRSCQRFIGDRSELEESRDRHLEAR
jgi:addiction module RelE/StbE family toxin